RQLSDWLVPAFAERTVADLAERQGYPSLPADSRRQAPVLRSGLLCRSLDEVSGRVTESPAARDGRPGGVSAVSSGGRIFPPSARNARRHLNRGRARMRLAAAGTLRTGPASRPAGVDGGALVPAQHFGQGPARSVQREADDVDGSDPWRPG